MPSKGPVKKTANQAKKAVKSVKKQAKSMTSQAKRATKGTAREARKTVRCASPLRITHCDVSYLTYARLPDTRCRSSCPLVREQSLERHLATCAWHAFENLHRRASAARSAIARLLLLSAHFSDDCAGMRAHCECGRVHARGRADR